MKRDGRKLAHNTLEEMRVLAVQRMKEGEHPDAVAASLGMNRSWAYKCRAAVQGRGRGLKALRSTKGTGRPRKLTPVQERQVFRWVNGKRPDQYSFDFGLWTRQIVRELVLVRFGVQLSLASIGALLARLGLTPQKPLERAYQRDPQAVERWKRETFPAIAAQDDVLSQKTCAPCRRWIAVAQEGSGQGLRGQPRGQSHAAFPAGLRA